MEIKTLQLDQLGALGINSLTGTGTGTGTGKESSPVPNSGDTLKQGDAEELPEYAVLNPADLLLEDDSDDLFSLSSDTDQKMCQEEVANDNLLVKSALDSTTNKKSIMRGLSQDWSADLRKDGELLELECSTKANTLEFHSAQTDKDNLIDLEINNENNNKIAHGLLINSQNAHGQQTELAKDNAEDIMIGENHQCAIPALIDKNQSPASKRSFKVKSDPSAVCSQTLDTIEYYVQQKLHADNISQEKLLLWLRELDYGVPELFVDILIDKERAKRRLIWRRERRLM